MPTGANRILLLNISSNVSNSGLGDRILFATSAFDAAMIGGGASTFAPDFLLTNAIPAAYLTAGRLTFEQDGGTTSAPGFIYWSLAWGGAGYTGSNTNSDSTNGSTGGTPFATCVADQPIRGHPFHRGGQRAEHEQRHGLCPDHKSRDGDQKRRHRLHRRARARQQCAPGRRSAGPRGLRHRPAAHGAESELTATGA